MKREFELDILPSRKHKFELGAEVKIIGIKAKHYEPYIKVKVRPTINEPFPFEATMEGINLERFAVNILKALNSKRVLQGKVPYYKRKK